jgi:O-antigen ligase
VGNGGRPGLERAQLGLTAAVAATCLVSIFAAQIALTLAVAVYLVRIVQRRTRFEHLALDAPILAFSIWTLLSASFSPDPVASHDEAKKLVLFTLFYLGVDILRAEGDRERVVDAALLGGLVLAAGSLLQYYFLGFDTLDKRPRSFLGHYMTASGLVMGVMVLAAARLAFRRAPLWPPARADLVRLAGLAAALGAMTLLGAADVFAVEGERLLVAALVAAAAYMAVSRGPWPTAGTGTTLAALAIPLSAWALLLSRTRNAWLGTLVGLAVVALLRAPRALLLVPVAMAAVLVLRPAPVIERLTVTDASSRDRYYMWQAGIDMILDKPVFGQGPGMILIRYPGYRWAEAPNPQTPHLHDNALQIAAERGLPCLAMWLWLVAAAMADAYREARRGLFGAGWVAGGALAVLAAVMTAGLFEYNFGDSEVLMFMLLVAAMPYALRRERERAAAAGAAA